MPVEYFINFMHAHIRDEYEKVGASFDTPVTEALLIQLVGYLGLDILKDAKFIEPTDVTGQYIWCECVRNFKEG